MRRVVVLGPWLRGRLVGVQSPEAQILTLGGAQAHALEPEFVGVGLSPAFARAHAAILLIAQFGVKAFCYTLRDYTLEVHSCACFWLFLF